MAQVVSEIIDADGHLFERDEALQSFLQRDDVDKDAKQKILCDNVKALYGMA